MWAREERQLRPLSLQKTKQLTVSVRALTKQFIHVPFSQIALLNSVWVYNKHLLCA